MAKKLFNLSKQELGVVVAFGLTILCTLWIHGCQSEVRSLSGNDTKVSRAELQNELDTYLALAKVRFDQLDKQDEFKQAVFNLGINIAEGGSINPLGMALIFGNIMGIGAAVDNVRKRKVIKTNLTEYVAATKKDPGTGTG